MPKSLCQKVNKCRIVFPQFLVSENNGKILLLVTDQFLLIMHQMLFKYYGYEVTVISQPASVCNYLKKYRPALVVFDMKVREKLCQRIAAHLKNQKIPALLIITTGEECEVCQYLEPKLCDYVDSLSDELHLIIKKAERLIKQGK